MLERVTKGYTFDDVLLVPGYSEVLPKDVNVRTNITNSLGLNIPIIAAAMDTVTDSKMAIAIAQEGGLGIIHKNMSPKLQADRVAIVKRHESGVVKDPITVSPNQSVRELLELSSKFNISGFPVVEDGKVVGIVTNRDTRFTALNEIVGDIMTKELITVNEGTSIDVAKKLIHDKRIERLLLVDNNNCLKGLITLKDLTKEIIFPNANKDKHGQLLVGAAVGTSDDTYARIELLIDAKVDIIAIDTAHGHSKKVIHVIKWLKKHYPNFPIIAGNIATANAANMLIDEGVDCLKVGIGPGSICTTRVVAGVGVPQLTAIDNVARVACRNKVNIIADGGIRSSGDIAKAIAVGANSVMLGNMLAGCDESPGGIEIFHGRSYKTYRGMGSISAMSAGSADRYFQNKNNKFVPEGIEGRVPYKGCLKDVLFQLIGGLSSAMGYVGAASIPLLQENATFVEITASGIKESHVHDVQIVKEAPNYNSYIQE